MKKNDSIDHFIDNSAYLYPAYICEQLKKAGSHKLIQGIMERSGKELSEAVLILVSVIKYTFPGGNAFARLEETDSFQQYIDDNQDLIVDLACRKKVQGNLPERGLPLLEVLHRELQVGSLGIVELGASFGLIGRCLLDPRRVIRDEAIYFTPIQQIPERIKPIDAYLGIEYDPPDRKWILASVWDEDMEDRLRHFIDDIRPDSRFELIKGNAFGFSQLKAVRDLVDDVDFIVVLTSFMLYQFDEAQQRALRSEIRRFTREVKGHWLDQAVKVSMNDTAHEYSISFNGKRVIDLADDACSSWRWLR